MSDDVHEGGCLCGGIRYRADGEPKWVAYCHCRSCRRATGGPVSAYAGLLRERFTWLTGEPARFESSPGVVRTFCKRCGTSLSYEGERWPGEIHVHIGTFDAPERLPPIGHAYASERIPWVEIVGLD